MLLGNNVGGRYTVLSTGELYIHQADLLIDTYQYRCQTKHSLTSEIKLSTNSGKLIITGNFYLVFGTNDSLLRLHVLLQKESILADNSVFCLLLSEPHTVVKPKIVDKKMRILAKLNQNVIIPCASQASSVPSIYWFKRSLHSVSTEDPILITSNNRIYHSHGILMIKSAQLSDTGIYICLSNNSMGEDKAERDVLITGQYQIYLRYVIRDNLMTTKIQLK